MLYSPYVCGVPVSISTTALFVYVSIIVFFALFVYFASRSERKRSKIGAENYQRKSYDHMYRGRYR